MSVNRSGGPVTPPPIPNNEKVDVEENKENKENQPNGKFELGKSNIPKPRVGTGPKKRSLADRFGNGNVTVTESGGPSIKKAKTDDNQLDEPGIDFQSEE